MPRVIGLRSPHAKVGRIIVFGRMLDKIRLHANGTLPAGYTSNLGGEKPVFFDGRCCRFLGVPYEDHEFFQTRTLMQLVRDVSVQEQAKAVDELLAYFEVLISKKE